MKTKNVKKRKLKTVVLDEKNIVSVLNQITPYVASVKIFGKVYTSTGLSVREAIENLKVDGKVGGVCVMTMTKGNVRREKILNSIQLFRLFTGSRILHEIALKNVSNLFDL